MSLSGRITLSMSSLLTGTHDFAQPSSRFDQGWQWGFTDGTGADQANRFWADRRTLAASGSESHDLAGGLTDALGTVLTFAKVRALAVIAAEANTNNVVIGGAASNALASMFGDASDKVVIKPGGAILLVAPDAAGYAVTANSGDLLQVANSGAGTPVTYDIAIYGTSA
jgi:hypothetical protein